MALIKAASLYSKPPKTVVGPNVDYRAHTLTTAQNVTGNLIAMAVLPARHRLIDLNFEVDPLDTGTALVLNVGILNSNYGAADDATPALVSGKNIITGATIGRSSADGRGGPTATETPSQAIGVDMNNDRIIAVEIDTQSTTAIEGEIAVSVISAED